MSSRSADEVVREQVVGPMIRRCTESLLGMDVEGVRLSIITDLDELRGMTKCDECPGGMDFSTDEHSARNHLYNSRDEMQEQRLYFVGERRLGIKWSAFPPTGLAWRITELFERSHPIVHQIAGWCEIEAARIGNPEVASQFKKLGHLYRDMERTQREIQAESDTLLAMIPGVLLAANRTRRKPKAA